MMDRTLYHGSSVIVEQPLASIGRRDLDFGPGFYLTPLREQAERWALRIRTIKNTSRISILISSTNQTNVLKKSFPLMTKNG